jgi:nucleoside-diphosphate-sugar epimerase
MGEGLTFPSDAVALVTGATGFTGSVLIKKLCECGIRVKAIARASSKRDAFQGLPIEWIEGNVYDPDTVERAMAGVDTIFHVAAAYREAGIKDETYRKVHLDSTQLLAQAALKNPNFKRFLHVSTVGVHGHIENPPANESYPFSPGDVYQQTKAEAELWLRDFAPKNGLPFTVIRPAAIYGPGDRRLLKIFKMATWPVFPVLGSSRGQLYHLIHVEDLAGIFIQAALHPKAQGEVFIGGDPRALALADIVSIISNEFGRKSQLIRVPAWPFFWMAALCETVCRPFGIAPPIYKRRVAFFTKDRSFDTSKLRNLLDFQYKWTTEQGLRETARWYRNKGWL